MQDVLVGKGVSPIVGYQITVNYVAMNAEGRAFDSSLEKGFPYDIRCERKLAGHHLAQGNRPNSLCAHNRIPLAYLSVPHT